MSRPLWLMMGSCFLLDPASLPSSSSWSAKAPFTFLTSAHTFLPWKWMPDPKELKIPEEFQKARYITGRVLMYDGTGQAVSSPAFTISPVRFHPTLDVCVLTMTGIESDAFRQEMKRRGTEKYFALGSIDPQPNETVVVSGFRGRGRLGELDTMDAKVLSTLPPGEQASLLKELEAIEGKQESAVCALNVVRRGVGLITHGACFNGMSGAPAQRSSTDNVCDGVLYGTAHRHEAVGTYPPEEASHIGFIPSTPIIEWLQ